MSETTEPAVGKNCKRINFLGVPLDTGVTAEDVCRLMLQKNVNRMVTFINPQAWAVARRTPAFLSMLMDMTLILPDGEGVARACRDITGLNTPRLSFDMTSLADPIFRISIAIKASLMLIGGKPAVDEMVQEKLQHQYPGINILGTAHGYDDFEPKIRRIQEAAPDIVVVGMGSPRQEQFILALRAAGYQGFTISCGGFFDQYLESDDYYPRWIDKYNLRFAFRLYKEPRRLWRRYLIDYQLFIWRVLKVLIERRLPGWLKKLMLKKPAA